MPERARGRAENGDTEAEIESDALNDWADALKIESDALND
jgi:hypothetical protein